MRYTKIALLTFGLGLLLGLLVIAAEIKSLGRVASALMALGIAAIPIGIIADLRGAVRIRPRIARRRARPDPRRPRRSGSLKR
jgi:hypothetical protein